MRRERDIDQSIERKQLETWRAAFWIQISFDVKATTTRLIHRLPAKALLFCLDCPPPLHCQRKTSDRCLGLASVLQLPLSLSHFLRPFGAQGNLHN